jgi:hypothetical protein
MATATATKDKTVFEVLDDYRAEGQKVLEQANNLRARIQTIDGEALALNASLVRDPKVNPAAVQDELGNLAAEKSALEAKVAATPAALTTIDGEAAAVRAERYDEFVAHADLRDRERAEAQVEFVEAAKRLVAAHHVSRHADREIGLTNQHGNSNRDVSARTEGRVSIGLDACSGLQWLDRTIRMWQDGGPRNIPPNA